MFEKTREFNSNSRFTLMTALDLAERIIIKNESFADISKELNMPIGTLRTTVSKLIRTLNWYVKTYRPESYQYHLEMARLNMKLKRHKPAYWSGLFEWIRQNHPAE